MDSAASQSILSRRPAAGGLPQFHLPPPNTSLDPQIPSMATSHRFLHYPSPPLTSSPPESRPETPSPHVQHNLPQILSSKHLTSSPGYSSHPSWSMSNNSSYTYGSINSGAQSSVMSSNYNRHLYSPSAPGAPGAPGQPGYSSRSSQSPATTDGMAQAYDNHSFPLSITGGATTHSSFPPQPSHSQHLQHAILGSQASQPPTPAATAPSESYSRPPPTPSYYAAASSTPQQNTFPSFPPPHPSPTQLSPTTTGGPTRAIPALSSQHHGPMGSLPPYANRHYSYSAPVSSLGPMVLSNMGNPGGQMHLMGGTNPLNAYHHPGHTMPHHLYPGAPNSQQERPYKCDICPQSFNRNHDLKRHKRIHLAVKPYPCEYCEKAFSRKDALKRHRLVKGCGNNGKTSPKSEDRGSPEHDSKMDLDGPSGSSGPIKPEPV
ncbi:hypothetical protein NPX13_g4309 [Xylaria arbuscula]|uniref:C2H2-type domain-containing protein n=1 Tax=Xylaria arbuscula TaxID=114810 RepID=A0A9W8NFR3_9PEZI|nr:hypothetical protein NPX13_g4309 [Xylaria arbuscula]